jgi:aldose 1-epimerase
MEAFMNAPQSGLLTLSSGSLELQLVPPLGGSIAGLTYATSSGERIPCLRGVEGNSNDPLDHACFPLVPFVNRIRGGRFVFRGREITLRPNLAGDPSPLHGQGWHSAWEVERAAEAEVALAFRHALREWPWAYEARQHFALDPEGLTVILSCINMSDAPMPCGLGLHPYFPCDGRTRLDARVDCAWTVGAQVLPVAQVPARGEYDLRERRICGQGLDNGFEGWSGVARIGTPGLPFRIELSSPDARYLHVYSPESGGFFAVEPVTHANAALNRPEEDWPTLGLQVLAPGETMSLTMRIAVIPVA